MAALVSDELWEAIEPLLPKQVPSPKGGRPPLEHRKALTGILFLLRHGLAYQAIPQELHCGSGSTVWRRLRAWTQLDVWPKLHAKLLEELGRQGQVDLSSAVIDSASVRALFGGPTPAATRPTAASKAPNAM